MVVRTIVTPKLSNMHESTTVQKDLINRNILRKITLQEIEKQRIRPVHDSVQVGIPSGQSWPSGRLHPSRLPLSWANQHKDDGNG